MEIKKRNKPTFELWEVIVIALISALVMSLATGYVIFRDKGISDCKIALNNPHIGEFINSYTTIINNFHNEVDENTLIEAAIKGMLSYLGDPYSNFLNEESSENLVNSLRGTFEGIGISLSNEVDEPIILHVFEDSPAEEAGILIGDIVRIINDTTTEGKTSEEVVALIRNSETNIINLTIEREETLLEFNLTKTLIQIPQVHSKIFEENNQRVGYLRVDIFSEIIGTQFQRRLNELEDENIDSLIIDLRNNSGGYLKGAVDIASMFLEEGSIIYQLRSRGTNTTEKVITNETRDYRVYILINCASASASEVLAAALRESYHGEVLIIGEQSYGKGFIQTTSTLSTGAMFTYTSAEWLTPEGNVVEGEGITPDYIIELNNEFSLNSEAENDNQLQAALNRITQR